MKGRAIAISGLTASGKTSLGLLLAKKFGGEIVSVDSRQLYKGMDIITGKDVGEAPFTSWWKVKENGREFDLGYHRLDGVRLWLSDLVTPDTPFSVADFLFCARNVLDKIWAKDGLPILVGGTGMYLKALCEGIETLGVPPDEAFRQEAKDWSVKKLQGLVKKEAPGVWTKLNRSDRANPHRLIRKLEIARAGETVKGEGGLVEDCLFLGIKRPLKETYDRIDARVLARLQEGAQEEVERLVKRYGWDSILGSTIGYQEWRPYFEKKATKEEVLLAWRNSEHAYARRQQTWFKKQEKIVWLSGAKNDLYAQAVEKIEDWLSGEEVAG